MNRESTHDTSLIFSFITAPEVAHNPIIFSFKYLHQKNV